MKRLNIADNSRIQVLLELVNSMNRLSEPRDMVERFVRTMRHAFENPCVIQIQTRGLMPGEYRIHQLIRDNEEKKSAAASNFPVQRGGVLGQIIADGSPGAWHELDFSSEPAAGEMLASYHSAIACPVFENDVGIDWVILLNEESNQFDGRDLEELVLRANLVAAMANNLETARKLMRASILIQRELEQIGRIQQALLPDELPQVPGLHIAASYNVFDRAGGDIYDIAPLGDRMEWKGDDEHRWLLLIGDVSGHGPAAAVVMAMFHAILHAYPTKPTGPGEVLSHVNKHLCAKQVEQSFVTAFLAFYDPKTRELVYARAGHEPPILKDFPHRGRPVYLDAVGEVPIGISPDIRYSEAKITLRPGQTMILYTDGITDARKPGGDMFGVEGIETSLIACTGAPDCAIRHITESLEKHQSDLRPADDQTVVAVQVV